MYYPLYYDSTYFLVLIGAVITMLASAKVKGTYARYERVKNHAGITGAQAAETILRNAGIYDVSVQRVSGKLTDHYDPSAKVLRLSDSTYGSVSVAALGVAAHECGHAIQHATNYSPLAVRSALVPVANLGSKLAYPLILLGLIFTGNTSIMLLNLGIIFFLGAVLFQVVTLPVEFNASSRAMTILEGSGMLWPDEAKKARKVLSAAAMTYVASVAASVLQLLRLFILAGGKRDD